MGKRHIATEADTLLARQARLYHNVWMEEFLPLELERIESLQQQGTDAWKTSQRNRAVGALRSSILDAGEVGAGQRPSGAAHRNAVLNNTQAEQGGYLEGLMSSSYNNEAQYMDGVSRLLSAGRSLGSSALGGMSTQGSIQSTVQNAENRAEQIRDDARDRLIGSVAGTAVGYGASRFLGGQSGGNGGDSAGPFGGSNVNMGAFRGAMDTISQDRLGFGGP